MHQEKVQQENLKAVKSRLNFKEFSQHSESRTPSRRRDLRKRPRSRHARSISGSPEQRCGRSESPRKRCPERKTMFKRVDKGVFHRLGDKQKGVSTYLNDSRHHSYYSSRRDTESCYKSSRSKGTKSASKRKIIPKENPHVRWKSYLKEKTMQEDTGSQGQKGISQVLRRMIYPNHGDRESTEEFVQRYKLECRDVMGALECMKISGFMTFLRGEVVASNHEWKKSFLLWKQQEAGQKQYFKKGGF
ncbi:hypothetical protein Tco_0982831 [Tanacetum coccineum]